MANQLHEDEILPPGTVRLIDVDGTLDSKHATGSGENDIVLVPAPSADPEDPLNWTYKRKLLSTSCILVYTFMIALPSGAVYSVVTPISKATKLTLTDLNDGTGIMFLFYGWGCILWQPLALQYGKRPAYILSLVCSIVIMATAPMCTTRGPYLANKVLQGLFGAPVESLCEISLTDIWFAHERPKYLAWYGFSLAVTGKLAPMFSGFINTGLGWKWTLYWCAIWEAIALVYCFFLMEETNYDRPHVAPTAHHSSPAQIDSASETANAEEKHTTVNTTTDMETGTVDSYPRKTYIQKLGFSDKKRQNRMLDILIAPFKGFTYPVVVYAGLMYGANSLVWSGVQNATTGTVYTTRYGFSTTAIALAYLGGFVGSIIGGYYCGKVGRILTVRLARKNGGLSEPEHTLYLFVASMILVPFSMLLYGLGVTYHIHWFGLVFSQASLAISNALSVAGALGYAISSYHALSGDMITTCLLIRNTLSFAINFGITPWLKAMGYRNTFITVACIGFVWNASLFLMVKYGRRLREISAPKYNKAVERARSKGLSH